MQEYKIVVRGLTGGASVLSAGVQNYSEFVSYLNEQYLSQGYELLGAPTLVRTIPPDGTNAGYSEWAYHLVKSASKKESGK